MGRELNKISKHAPIELIEQIKALYAAAESHTDVEDIELQYRDNTFCNEYTGATPGKLLRS